MAGYEENAATKKLPKYGKTVLRQTLLMAVKVQKLRRIFQSTPP